MGEIDAGTIVMVFLQLAMGALWVAVWSRFGRIEKKLDTQGKDIGDNKHSIGIVKERLRGHMETGGH